MAVEKREYFGWRDSYWLANGDVELVVPAEIGPRIVRYGFAGGQNLFHNFPHALGNPVSRSGRIAAGTGSGRPRRRPSARL